jgi:hypothetical protein
MKVIFVIRRQNDELHLIKSHAQIKSHAHNCEIYRVKISSLIISSLSIKPVQYSIKKLINPVQ